MNRVDRSWGRYSSFIDMTVVPDRDIFNIARWMRKWLVNNSQIELTVRDDRPSSNRLLSYIDTKNMSHGTNLAYKLTFDKEIVLFLISNTTIKRHWKTTVWSSSSISKRIRYYSSDTTNLASLSLINIFVVSYWHEHMFTIYRTLLKRVPSTIRSILSLIHRKSIIDSSVSIHFRGKCMERSKGARKFLALIQVDVVDLFQRNRLLLFSEWF